MSIAGSSPVAVQCAVRGSKTVPPMTGRNPGYGNTTRFAVIDLNAFVRRVDANSRDRIPHWHLQFFPVRTSFCEHAIHENSHLRYDLNRRAFMPPHHPPAPTLDRRENDIITPHCLHFMYVFRRPSA